MLFRGQRPTVYEQTNHRSASRLGCRSPTANERDAPIHHEVGWMKSAVDDRAIFDIPADGTVRIRTAATLGDWAVARDVLSAPRS